MRTIGQTVSEKLLPRVRRPGQYVGLEHNACRKDPQAASVSVCMAFPDAYSIGISHLGSQLLYRMLNGMDGVACDRTYCPLLDAEQAMRVEGIPLFGWESRCAVGDFDILGFSLTYELCITNVLTMLDLAGVPLRSADRVPGNPIVVGGDALADSPEPLADFFDVFISGDGEEPLAKMVEIVAQAKKIGIGRHDLLLEIAKNVPSAYVPMFYSPIQNGPHLPSSVMPLRDDVPASIRRACLRNLADSPAVITPLVPLAQGIHERVVVEIMRGCPNACRFCQAGATRLPIRRRSVEEIVQAAKAAIAATGFSEIGLLSLSTSDYPDLEELIHRLSAEFTPKHVSISLPSLRVSSQLKLLPALTSEVRKGGLTIAAEAGSRRLREAIRKEITEQDMIEGVKSAYRAGWRSVKVYFLAGLPGETPADIDEIFKLCLRLADARREVDGHRGSISASVSWLVPKPHTPMQWFGMKNAEYMLTVRKRLVEISRGSPVNFRFHRVERSLLEGLLCRGDRSVGRTIEQAWRNGARLDAWDEHWDYSKWATAFEQTGLDVVPYVHRELPPGAALPWSHIISPRGLDFLKAEHQRIIAAINPDNSAGTPE
ncbi:MAG: TIGR03960 family B12-binding radical SAM protein [Planctomycetes bacterium]|nr:TIGR03960 family B12-binding radical SAM protein [Planctomycetota bacterium]